MIPAEEAPKEAMPETPTADGTAIEQYRPIPAEAVSKTREELAVKFEQLAARARAAGMSPLQAMAQTYVKRGMAVLDSVLRALEDVPEEAPKKTPADTEKKV